MRISPGLAFLSPSSRLPLALLPQAADFCPKDTPTKLLLKEMKMRSIDPVTPTAPVDWKGYHSSEV